MGQTTRAQQVDPEVRARALELAGGDPQRLDVRDPRTVVVLNRPRP